MGRLFLGSTILVVVLFLLDLLWFVCGGFGLASAGVGFDGVFVCRRGGVLAVRGWVDCFFLWVGLGWGVGFWDSTVFVEVLVAAFFGVVVVAVAVVECDGVSGIVEFGCNGGADRVRSAPCWKSPIFSASALTLSFSEPSNCTK